MASIPVVLGGYAAETGRNAPLADPKAFLNACEHGIINKINKLLDQGCPVDITNDENTTGLLSACSSNQMEVVELLISKNCNIYIKNKYGTDAFLASCRSCNIDIILLLIQHGCDINIQNNLGETGLIRLLKYGKVMERILVTLKALIKSGCDTNLVTKDNKSAARIAYDNGYTDCLKILADIDAKDSRELLPYVACASNDIELLRAQLVSNPAIVNTFEPVSRDALIHIACRNNNQEILSLLIEYNVDVNVTTRENKSAARIAYEYGYIDILKLLVDSNAIASREFLACAACKLGDVALLRAQLNVNQDIVKFYIPKNYDNAILKTTYHIEHPLQKNTGIRNDGYDCDICSVSGVSAYYCKKCNFDVCIACLDKSTEGSSKDTFVHLVCEYNRPLLLLELIEYRIDLNLLSSDNKLAARIAYDKGSVDCLKILADKDATDSRELLAHVACVSNDTELLRAQLASNPAVVSSVEPVSRDALIHIACRNNRPDILLLLIEYNTDVNVMTRDNKSSARLAYGAGSINCLKLLFDNNAVDSMKYLRMTNSNIFHVLRGGFMTEEYKNWKVPSFSLKYFVSSTFTDTHEERNVILTRLLPELNAIARPHGIDITFVDMRWGVKDENTDDHKTWDACKVELERCIEESCETFFISLQGYKYGYRPLPREIEQVVFDNHVNKYNDVDKDDLIALAKKWYILDSNSIPPKYVLMKLDDSNRSDYWSNVLSKLLTLLTGLMFEGNLYIGDSVTNWEATCALNAAASDDRIFWMRREIVDAITDLEDQWKEYNDTRGNVDVENRLNNLLDTMTSKLGGSNNHIHTTIIDNVLSIKNKGRSLKNYIEELYSKLKMLLTSEVNRVIQRKEDWLSNAYGSGLSGDICIDMLHHYSFARRKVNDFEGRHDLINAAIDMIKQSNRDGGICSIVGKSGCGKTCFMAKLASLLYKTSSGIPVIIRFCGTNDNSSSGLKLLQSIVRQIRYVYGVSDVATIPEVYNELVECFQSLISAYPVVLLIDSIDQLTNDNQERRKISFLNGIKVNQQTKIVLSCLPDEYDSRTKTGYCYGCDNTLKEWKVPRIEIKSISNDMELILDSYLSKSARCLTQAQRDIVLNSAAQQSDPTVLFVKLAARVACSWKSNDIKSVIPNSVPLLINQIFDEVQHNYGILLIKAVVAFITLATNGVTSEEMEDLLSLDDEVMKEVNKYNQSTRLPSHVWLRVKNELSGLLVVSDQGCMKWYHRQLWETANDRYTVEEKIHYHQIVGRYFSNTVDRGILDTKGIYKQELLNKSGMSVWFRTSNPFINKRRCTEGGYHLIMGRLYAEAIKELCDLQHVCACIKSGNGFRLVNSLILINRNISIDEKNQLGVISERAYQYMRWLTKEMNFIVADVELHIISTASSEPLVSCVKKDVDELFINHTIGQSKGTTPFSRESWVRGRTLGTVDNFNPLLMNLTGHENWVRSVSFNHSGTLIVTGSEDETIRVWDSMTGVIINTFIGHRDQVNSVSFNYDGSLIVSGSSDNTIKVWDTLTGEVIHTLRGHCDKVVSVSYNHCGTQIVSSSDDKTIKLWESASGKLVNTFTGHSSIVYSVSFNHNGSLIVSGSHDETIKLWDSITGHVIRTFTGHSDRVTSVSFNCDGLRIVSGSRDNSIKIWDSITGEIITTFTGHSSDISSVSFDADGTRVVSSSHDKSVKIWDSVTGEVITTFNGHSGSITSISCNHDSTRIVSGSIDNTIKVWDSVTCDKINLYTGHVDWVLSVAFNTDGSRIVSASRDKTIKIWDSMTGTIISTLTGHSDRVTSVSFNHDGSLILSGSWDKSVVLWSSMTGDIINTFIGHNNWVLSVSFNRDGTRIVSGSQDHLIKVWDSLTGEIINTFTGHSDRVTSVSFNHTGGLIASGSGDGMINIWDSFTGKVINTFTGHSDKVTSVSFNYDGTRVISGSNDETITLWDSVTGEIITAFTGHTDGVTSVSFNHDGSKIVSGGVDKSVKLWDSVTGEIINTFTGHSSHVNSVSFNHDGSKIVSGGEDKSVKLWDSL